MHSKKLINSYAEVIAKRLREYINNANLKHEKVKDLIFHQLRSVQAVISNDKIIFDALTSPLVDKKHKDDLLKIIIEKLALDLTVSEALMLITRHDRINLIYDIVSACIEILDQEEKIIAVTIISAKKIEIIEIKALEEYLKKLIATEIKAHYEVNTDLIGGMIIKYNNEILDCSIKGALKKISKSAISAKL